MERFIEVSSKCLNVKWWNEPSLQLKCGCFLHFAIFAVTQRGQRMSWLEAWFPYRLTSSSWLLLFPCRGVSLPAKLALSTNFPLSLVFSFSLRSCACVCSLTGGPTNGFINTVLLPSGVIKDTLLLFCWLAWTGAVTFPLQWLSLIFPLTKLFSN